MTKLVSMPVDLVTYLRDTIQETGGEDEADFAVYQFGREWGKDIVRISGESCDLDDLTTKATLTAVHSGVTNMTVEVENQDIRVKTYDSNIYDNYFLSGFISGIVSELLNENYICEEKDGYFHLSRNEKKVEKELSEMVEKKVPDISLPNMNKGESYLVIEETKRSAITFNTFLDALKKGIPGLCFTRLFPPKIKDKFEGEDFPMFWLSTIDGTDGVNTIKPENFKTSMNKIITSFLKAKRGIVMIHGIEYLISNNGFKEVLNFIQRISDVNALNEGVILVSVYPKALDEKDFNNLKSELNQYDI